jgi:ATP-dependent Clp protease ATP-binding subunit ClpA
MRMRAPRTWPCTIQELWRRITTDDLGWRVCLLMVLIMAGCSVGWDPFANYTMDARRVILNAHRAVSATGGSEITPEHLVLGLLESDVHASEAFRAKSIDIDTMMRALRLMLGSPPRPNRPDIPLAAVTGRILDLARDEAKRRANAKVTSEDILVAVMLEDTPVAHLLLDNGLRVDEVRRDSKTERP